MDLGDAGASCIGGAIALSLKYFADYRKNKAEQRKMEAEANLMDAEADEMLEKKYRGLVNALIDVHKQEREALIRILEGERADCDAKMDRLKKEFEAAFKQLSDQQKSSS